MENLHQFRVARAAENGPDTPRMLRIAISQTIFTSLPRTAEE